MRITPDSRQLGRTYPDSKPQRKRVNMTFQVQWNEDADATVLARITARTGSGAATGVAGEGNWLEQADISSITCKVFDRSSDTPGTEIATPTVTVSTSVVDTPVTATTLWTKDSTGYNFIHDVAASNFPTGNHTYRIEYTVTLVGGAVFHGNLEGVAKSVVSS